MNNIKLYHFSNKKFDNIKPDYIGYNSYTKNDYNISDIKRFFCYDTIVPAEYHLNNSKYRYTLNIDKNNIYDLIIDKDNLISKFKTIHELLIYLSQNYIGIVYNVGFNCYAIFKNIKPDNIEKLF